MELPRREMVRRAALSGLSLTAAGSRLGIGTAMAARPTAAPPSVRRSVLLRYGVDGSIRWQVPVPLGQDEHGSDVVLARGRVFAAQGGAVRSFDLASGRPGWVRPVSTNVQQLLAIDGLIVAVVTGPGGRDPRVAAYDQSTGRHRWTAAGGADFIVAYPVRAGLVIAQQRFRTVALDTATGRVRWTAPVPGHDDGGSTFAQLGMSPSVVVQGGVVTTTGLDAGSGRRLWARALPLGAVLPVLTASVAVLAPLAFGEPGAGGVVALDARTGAHRWTVPSRNESGSVVNAGYGVVVAVTGDTVAGGRTTAVAAESGRVLWSAPVPASPGTDQPSAMTAHGVAYIEDLWHDGGGHQHRSIALVNRSLRDGGVRYRRPIAGPTAQGTPPRLHGRFLPLVLEPGGHGPIAVRLFDLATGQVRFTARAPHWPTASPVALSDGSVLSLTADLETGVAV